MEFKTKKNGAKVIITPAPLKDAFKLKSAIEKAMLAQNVNLEKALDEDIVKLIMTMDSSEEVYNTMFQCLSRCSYNSVKITEETFEDESARYDLYEVFFHCLKVNVFPFFESLLSGFFITSPVMEVGIQEQK